MIRHKKPNTHRLGDFSDEDIIKLIKEVEQREFLWNRGNKKHFDANALKGAWESVAVDMNRDSVTCRNGWRSLMDSHRYHIKKLLTYGSSDWQFAPHMAFFTNHSSRRRTYDSPYASNFESPDFKADIENDTMTTDENSCGESEQAISEQAMSEQAIEKEQSDLSDEPSYSYKTKAKRRKVEKGSSTSQVVGILEQLVDQKLSVRPAFTYWESYLRQLSKSDAARVERKMTEVLFEQLDALDN